MTETEQNTDATATAARGKILVVDDERGPRESLFFLLKREFDVILSDSVAQGIEALRTAAPDLVIMDIRMPGRSGIEGLAEMKAIAPDVSIIMLTGYGTLETAQEAIRHGASDYLKKPFDTTNMLSVVRRNIARTQLNRRRSIAEEQLSEISETLRKKMASRDRLSTLGLASSELMHDLRNPLGVILGYAELLSEDLRQIQSTSGTLPPDTLEYLNTIEKNVRVCTELTEMWRNLGSGDAQRSPPLALWPLIEEIVRSIRRPSDGISFDLDASPENRKAQVRGERLQLRRAFQNLIGNALDAVDPQTGRIHLTGSVDGETVTIALEDNGCGIESSRLASLFEPFHETSKGKKGTGLGLFIAHKVIQDHAGTITIDSEVGRGTRVRVRLPLAHA